jgi:hypothetical protein
MLLVQEGSSLPVRPIVVGFSRAASPWRTTVSLSLTDQDDEGASSKNSEGSGDFPPEDFTSEYTGSVDWVAEWKKVVKNGGVAGDRLGKEYYKSEAKISAIVSCERTLLYWY